MAQISNPTGNTSFNDGDYMLSPSGTVKLTYRYSNFSLIWVSTSSLIWGTSNAPNPGVTAVFFRGNLSIGTVWNNGIPDNYTNATLLVTDDGFFQDKTAGGVVLWQNGMKSSFRVLELLKASPIDIQGAIDALESNHIAEIAHDQDRQRRLSQVSKENGHPRHGESPYAIAE